MKLSSLVMSICLLSTFESGIINAFSLVNGVSMRPPVALKSGVGKATRLTPPKSSYLYVPSPGNVNELHRVKAAVSPLELSVNDGIEPSRQIDGTVGIYNTLLASFVCVLLLVVAAHQYALAPLLAWAAERAARGSSKHKLKLSALAVNGYGTSNVSGPSWALPREPFKPGEAPENGTWAPTDQTVNDFLSLYRNTTLSVEEDSPGFEISGSNITGDIPAELKGTLFRNGPGLLEIYGNKLNQFFDGDGLVYAVEFEDGKVKFRHNFVGTKGFTEEKAAQKMLYKGAFAIGNPKGESLYNPFDFNVKNVANTGVVNWAGETYALWEGGRPHRMSSEDLRTTGVEVDEVLGAKLRVPQMAAHYRIWEGESKEDKRLIAFSIEAQASFPQNVNRAAFYEWDRDGKNIVTNNFDVPDATFGFFHDFLVTENWYFLFQNPTSLSPSKLLTEYMFAKCALAETLAMVEGKPAILHCLPRTDKAKKIGQKSVELKPQFFFHHINAFERDNEVVLDSIPWQYMDFCINLESVAPDFYSGRGPRVEYTRFVLQPNEGTCTQKILSNRVIEFPTMNNKYVGRPQLFSYACGTVVSDAVQWGPNQCLVKNKVDHNGENAAEEQIWYFGERCFVQEPIFVPRPGGTEEDDGWVLQVVNDAGAVTSTLHILEAKDITKGPIASILFEGEHLPPGLHGMWAAKED